jgi:hypothetical protein
MVEPDDEMFLRLQHDTRRHVTASSPPDMRYAAVRLADLDRGIGFLLAFNNKL